jgi:hypothetical protein
MQQVLSSRVSPRKVDRPERRSTTSSEKLPSLTISSASPSTFVLRDSVNLRPQSSLAATKSPFAASFHVSHSSQSPAYAAPLPVRTVHAHAVPPVSAPRTAITAASRAPAPVAATLNIDSNNYDSSDDDDDESDNDEIFSGGLELTGGLVMGASPSLNSRQLDLYYQTLQKGRSGSAEDDLQSFVSTPPQPSSHQSKLFSNSNAVIIPQLSSTPRLRVDSALEKEVEALSLRNQSVKGGGGGGEMKLRIVEEKEKEEDEDVIVVVPASVLSSGEEIMDDKRNGSQKPPSISTEISRGGVGGVQCSLTQSPFQSSTSTPTRLPANLTPTQLALFRRTLAPTSSPSALLNAHLHSASAKTSDLRRIALSQSARRGISSSSSSLPSPHQMTVSTLALDELALASLQDGQSGSTNENDDEREEGGEIYNDELRISSGSLSATATTLSSSALRGLSTLGKSGLKAATQSAARAEAAETFTSSPSFLDKKRTTAHHLGTSGGHGSKNSNTIDSFSPKGVNFSNTLNTTNTASVGGRRGQEGGGGGGESPAFIVARNSNDRPEYSAYSPTSSSHQYQEQQQFPLSSPMRLASSSSSSSTKLQYDSRSDFSPSNINPSGVRSSNSNAPDKLAISVSSQEKSSLISRTALSPQPPSNMSNNNNNNDPDQSLDDFASLLVSPNRAQMANVNLHGSSVETRFQAMLDAKFKQIGGDEDDL